MRQRELLLTQSHKGVQTDDEDRAKIDTAIRELHNVMIRAIAEGFNGTVGVRVSRHSGRFRGVKIIREWNAD